MDDLHNEFAMCNLEQFEGTKDDVVILAGDIGVGEEPDTYIPFLRDLAARVKCVFYIPGNHEYYGGHIDTTFEKMFNLVRADPALNDVVFDRRINFVIDDVALIGATLWTDMRGDDWVTKKRVRDAMNDFHVILAGPTNKKFHPDDAVEIFNYDYAFISDSIKIHRANGIKKIVVFTHHGVTEQACLPEYKGNALNPGWITNLEEEIMAWQPNYWIHGHLHNTVHVEIDKTVVLTNPRGYGPKQLNKMFDINAHVEL